MPDTLATHAPLALTCGEPAGIGPDLCLAVAGAQRSAPLVCIADRALLEARARQLGLDCRFEDYARGAAVATAAGVLCVLHRPLARPATPGRADPGNARAVLGWIDRAVDGCLGGEFAAMVTAPVHKAVICDSGIPFSGHTEYIASRCGAARPVMLLVAGDLRVALATTHLPLRAVADAIDGSLLDAVLDVLAGDLARRFGLPAPRIAVCGLNPHAGESGHLGDEELRVIAPAIARARARGLHVDGPLPADTLFVPRVLEPYDAVLAMYHDQGLPVLKHSGFGHAVNVTLGLPLLRTSVDHGTAFDLAGSGRADAGSLEAAITLAARLAATAGARPDGTAARP